jgi:hypothetical protein
MRSRYVVFDCLTTTGFSHMTRFRWKAHLVAVLLSRRTGRLHDYESYGRYLQGWN